MTPSEKIGIAAHMHVMLRRKTGRVTDTEWMACNVDYAAEIVRFARDYAAAKDHPDLANMAGKLAQAMLVTGSAPVVDNKPDPVPESTGLMRYVKSLR